LIDTPRIAAAALRAGASRRREARQGDGAGSISRRRLRAAAAGTRRRFWHREALLAGQLRLPGRPIVEEISATTVLYPGDRARVDPIGQPYRRQFGA